MIINCCHFVLLAEGQLVLTVVLPRSIPHFSTHYFLQELCVIKFEKVLTNKGCVINNVVEDRTAEVKWGVLFPL